MYNLQAFLDIIFPPTADARLVRDCSTAAWASHYQPRSVNNTVTLLPYANPLVAAVISEHKFHHLPQARALLTHAFQCWYQTHAQPNDIYIPIPLHHTRQRQRGYNQVTEVLATVVPGEQLRPQLLARHRPTAPQSHLPKDERLKNIRGAFNANLDKLASLTPTTRLIIVDDVYTTGATMTAARAALAPHLLPTQSIITIAFAH